MNIAFFTDTYSPQINGVVTSIRIFKEELERQGHRVYVFCPSYGGREEPEENVFRVFSIPYPTERMKDQRLIFPLCRAFLKFRGLGIDIVHFHVPHYLGAYGILLAKLWKIPVVHTYHTLFVQYTHYVKMRRSLAVKAVKFISRNFANRCVRVIVPSPEVREELASYGVKPPIDVIPTGIEIVRREPHESRGFLEDRYRLPKDKKRLIFVGRFAREKNIDMLLSMMCILREKKPGYHLLLAGDGPDRPRLDGIIDDLALRDCVTVTGFIPRSRVFDLLRYSDLLVFPSATETQGLVLLEAMSVGLPVVAVDAMGASDVMRDGRGGIAARNDLGDFIAAVEGLLCDRVLYDEKSRNGREKVLDWSTETMTRRLTDFYRRSIFEYRNERRGETASL